MISISAKMATTTSISKLAVTNEKGNWIFHQVLGYTDEGDKRMWKISLSVGSKGNRIVNFIGYDKDNKMLCYTVE